MLKTRHCLFRIVELEAAAFKPFTTVDNVSIHFMFLNHTICLPVSVLADLLGPSTALRLFF